MSDYTPASSRDVSDPADREETARYIGRMAGELRHLADRAKLPLLAYLLGMAEDEALSKAVLTEPGISRRAIRAGPDGG